MSRARLRAFRHFSEWMLLDGVLLAVGAALLWGGYQEHEAVRIREEQRLLAQARMIDVNLHRQLDALNRALLSIRALMPTWPVEGTLTAGASARLTAFA